MNANGLILKSSDAAPSTTVPYPSGKPIVAPTYAVTASFVLSTAEAEPMFGAYSRGFAVAAKMYE